MNDRHRKLIEEQLNRDALVADAWGTGEDGEETAMLGQWEATDDLDDGMVCEGEVGALTASVVGSPEHGNERVRYTLTVEGCEHHMGAEALPGLNAEPAQ